MSNRISVTEFVRSFSDFINRVAFAGERYVLVRGRRELAEVVPVVRGRRLGELPDILSSLPSLGADADQFADDIRDSRAFLAGDEDPWES